MAIESLRQPHAKMTPFDKLMNELPNGMDSLYRQAMQVIQVDDRQMLLVALRWLLFGEGEIDATLSADELEHMYEEEDEFDEEEIAGEIETRDFASTNDLSVIFLPDLSTIATPPVENSGGVLEIAEQYDEMSRATIDEPKRIDREFMKFDSHIIGLQQNSLRGFIVADEKHMHRSGSPRCSECAERFSQTSTYQAIPKYGHFLMVENILRKLNSSSIQKKLS